MSKPIKSSDRLIVNVLNDQKDLLISSEQVEPILRQILAEEKIQCDEISVYFVSESAICELHRTYFDDPSPTDCISFPIDSEDDLITGRHLGEIFVCPKTAIHYASQHHLDPYEETTLYIIHGVLHLLGYDDILEEDIVRIRDAEKHHLEQLRVLKLILTGPIKL